MARVDQTLVIVDLEVERRLAGRFEPRASQFLRRHVGLRNVLQYRDEYCVGRDFVERCEIGAA